jgi:peptide/nickel transport system permease protein
VTIYILRRLAMLVPVLVGISIVVFLLLRLLPGDTVDAMLSDELRMAPETYRYLRQQMGLDDPIYVQYLRWLGGVVQGDLGRSMRTNQPVFSMITSRLPITLQLALLSVVLSLVLAVPLGVVSAVRRNSGTDFWVRILGLVGQSLPNFWLAAMLMLVASRTFQWLPPLMFTPFTQDPAENLKQMLLPALSLAVALMAVTMRMTRSCLLEVLGQDYIRTARAKGLGERLVLARHALRNALIPVITIVGIQMGNLLGGTVIIEQIFGLPGVGWMLLQGIQQRDYPVVQGGTLWLALMFVLINLVVDAAYSYLDPRIRYA